MKCPFCGYQFEEKAGKATCEGCLLARGCHMVRCPNCGYDMPTEPKLIKVFKDWRRRDNETGRKG